MQHLHPTLSIHEGCLGDDQHLTASWWVAPIYKEATIYSLEHISQARGIQYRIYVPGACRHHAC